MIRDATAADHPAILALNLAERRCSARSTRRACCNWSGESAYHRVLCEGPRRRLPARVPRGRAVRQPQLYLVRRSLSALPYIDRVVVAASHQGGATELYRDLFEFAGARGVKAVTCEFYTRPPNEASRRHHAGFGFREVGQQWVADGRKQVSLQVADVTAAV